MNRSQCQYYFLCTWTGSRWADSGKTSSETTTYLPRYFWHAHCPLNSSRYCTMHKCKAVIQVWCLPAIYLLSKIIVIQSSLYLFHLESFTNHWCIVEQRKLKSLQISIFLFFLKKKKKVSFVSAPTFHLSNNWYLLNHKHTFHHLKSPQVSLYSLLLHRWRAAQQAFVKPILWSTIVLMSWTFLLTWPHEREWYAFHSFICTYLEPMWDKEMRNYASKF